MAWPMANDPPFATLNHFIPDLGIPRESGTPRPAWYNLAVELQTAAAMTGGDRHWRDVAVAARGVRDSAAGREGAALRRSIETRRRTRDRFQPLAAARAVNGRG